MKDFTLHIPTSILFGPSHGSTFAKSCKALGTRALMVLGGQSAENLGYRARLSKLLEAEGIAVTVFSGVEPNPLAQTVDRAALECSSKDIEFIVALGGGSVMDAAKGIACLLGSGEKEIWPFVIGEPKAGQLKGALPLCAVPTTAASASEVTPYAVISNTAVQGKSVITLEALKPRVAWLNPEFTLALPAVTTRDGAADILSHLLENYLLGGEDSLLADRYTESVLRTVLETLPLVIESPEDYNYRATLLWASTLALYGMQSVGRNKTSFVLHAIEHSMSAVQHSLAHGRGLATLFPAYFRWLWNTERARARLARLGRTLFDIQDESDLAGLQFIEHFEEWLKANELYQSLRDVGIHPAQHRTVAEYAIRTSGGGRALDALGDMGVDDILQVLELSEKQFSD